MREAQTADVQLRIEVRSLHSRAGMMEPKISAIHLQCGDKSFLRDVDFAELPHLLLALVLLLQRFSFAGDVVALAFGGDVLAQRAHGFRARPPCRRGWIAPVSMSVARPPPITRAAMMASCR